MEQQDIYSLYGIEEEEFKKSKDVFPTLELGKISDGAKIVLKCLESEPTLQSHKKKFNLSDEEKAEIKKTGEHIMMVTPIIKVAIKEIIQPAQKNEPSFSVPMNDEIHTLWLSSKTLRMGFLKIAENHNGNMENIKLSILKGTAIFKDFGENVCYSVSEISESE